MQKFIWAVMLVALMTFSISGCSKNGGGDVSQVKNGYLSLDKSINVGQAFDGYKYFKTKEWKAFKTEQGRRIVEFNGEIDLTKDDNVKMAYKDCAAVSFSVKFVINADSSFEVASVKKTVKLSDGTSNTSDRKEDLFLRWLYNNETLG